MITIHSSRPLGVTLGLLLGASLAAGCTSTSSDNGKMIGSSAGASWMVYSNPYPADSAKAGMTNPIGNTVAGSAAAFDMGGRMKLTLVVSGLPPSRQFGSHLHKQACDDNKAGGHFQHNPNTTDSGANDPSYANSTNEAWLDFTTDAAGKAVGTTLVDWIPPAAQARSIVVHDMGTQPGGVAGAKLACLPMTFQ
jgi:Cu/Zn superoxide dismutase